MYVCVCNLNRCKELVIFTLFKMIEHARWTVIEFYNFLALNYRGNSLVKWKLIAIEIQNESKSHLSYFCFIVIFRLKIYRFMYNLKFMVWNLYYMRDAQMLIHIVYCCFVDFERKINRVSNSVVALFVVIAVVFVCGPNFSEIYSKLDLIFREKTRLKLKYCLFW